jgi:hypothetical protein
MRYKIVDWGQNKQAEENSSENWRLGLMSRG